MSQAVDQVDQVVERVIALNRAGRIEDASVALKAALEAQRAREPQEAAAMVALLRQAVQQAVLVRSVEDAARFTVELVDRGEEVEPSSGQPKSEWRELIESIWLTEEPGEPDTDAGLRFRQLRSAWMEWCDRGDRDGLNFDLEVAVMLAQELVRRAKVQSQRASALFCLGAPLGLLGDRESGTGRLLEANEAIRASLAEQRREEAPVFRALTEVNLTFVLCLLGERESGIGRIRGAVETVRDSLAEEWGEKAPILWEVMQNNLGYALTVLGEREEGTERLMEALEVLQALLAERTREESPVAWSHTQNSLGYVLSLLGEREGRTDRLIEATAAFRRALEEARRDRVPLDWARNQSDLGHTLVVLGRLRGETGPLEEAVAALRAALQEATQERAPLAWAVAQERLASAELAWAEQVSASEAQPHLLSASACCQAALEGYDSGNTPYQCARASALLDRIRAALAKLDAGHWPASTP